MIQQLQTIHGKSPFSSLYVAISKEYKLEGVFSRNSAKLKRILSQDGKIEITDEVNTLALSLCELYNQYVVSISK